MSVEKTKHTIMARNEVPVLDTWDVEDLHNRGFTRN